MAIAVDRPVAPGTEIRLEAGRYAIRMPLVEFGIKAVHRTIALTLGLISLAAVVVKLVNDRFVPFLELAVTVRSTTIHAAIAASFALGP